MSDSDKEGLDVKLTDQKVNEILSFSDEGFISGGSGNKGVAGGMCMQSVLSYVAKDSIFDENPSCVESGLNRLSVWMNDYLFSDLTIRAYLQSRPDADGAVSVYVHNSTPEERKFRSNELKEYMIAQIGSANIETDYGKIYFFSHAVSLCSLLAVIEEFKSHDENWFSGNENLDFERIYALSNFIEEFPPLVGQANFDGYVVECSKKILSLVDECKKRRRKLGIFEDCVLSRCIGLICGSFDGVVINTRSRIVPSYAAVSLVFLSKRYSNIEDDMPELLVQDRLMSLRRRFTSNLVKMLEFSGTKGSKYLYLVRGN